MDKNNNDISQKLISLNFELSKNEIVEYKINRTFANNKFSEILLYKNINLIKITSNKNDLHSLYGKNLIARFVDSEESWLLAVHCCNLTSDIYTNGIMLDPHGNIMCRCGKDRIKWYLKKGLAKLESNNPPTIRLNFEPEASGKKNDPYYLQEIKNQCVICGSIQDLSKHHVIPYCFRKFFPKAIKENSSHDILLLCRNHHNQYEKEADKLKKELAKKYKCKMSGVNLKVDLNSKKVKDAAIALLRKNNKISLSKVKKFKRIIREHYKKQKFSARDLERAIKIKYRIKDENYIPYGQYVINSVESLDDFMIMWRKHFVGLMSPKFLPEYWDVNKRITIT